MDIELSKPSMLKGGPRILISLLLLIPLGLVLYFTDSLAHYASTQSHQAISGSVYIGLAIVGLACLIAILVLVMGYGTVVIKATTPTPSSAKSS